VLVIAAVAGFLVAAFATIAGGKSFTLRVARNVHVNNTAIGAPVAKMVNVHENVAVGPNGYAVYTFQGETTHHLICKSTGTPSCWSFWPPLTVRSAKGLAAQKGIKGKLGTFHNHGKLQVTLGGKPLYQFAPDIGSHKKSQASGDELKTFNSVWHIVKASGATSQSTNSTSSSTTSTSSSSTTSCAYPPYCY
jgi:predicted lipoprotein with Yx(FWY)xxD motif